MTTKSAHERPAAPTAVVPLSPLDRETSHYEPALSAAVQRVVHSGYYVGGPEVASFTNAFAAYCGVSHCLGVGNGTDALEIALRAVGVSAGDEVITVANAGGYSTTAILAIGAVPVYADIDPETTLLDVGSAAAVVSEQTRAIVATHLYGAPVDVDAVRAALTKTAVGAGAGAGAAEAGTAEIAIVEDCAQAHGATARGRRVGSLGDVAAFSFYPTKNLGALGDAGAVTTNDTRIAERAAAIAQYGWAEQRYHATVSDGRNSRLDPVQAAALAVKLAELDVMNARRRAIAARYSDALSAVDGIRLLHADLAAGSASVFHLAVLDCDDRIAVAGVLEAAGVQTAVHYPTPDHDQPAYDGRFVVRGSLDNTERAAARVLTIPCHPLLSDAEVERVCAALRALPGEPA